MDARYIRNIFKESIRICPRLKAENIWNDQTSQKLSTHMLSYRQGLADPVHCLYQTQYYFFESIAQSLSNMGLVVNTLDEPRVVKNQCPSGTEWQPCACDKDCKIPNHGFFLRPSTWTPIDEKAPIFSSRTISSCFSDILMSSYLYLDRMTTSIPSIVHWKEKIFKLFWRGSTTGAALKDNSLHYSLFHRQKLVELCSTIKECDAKFFSYHQCHPDICDAMRMEYGGPHFVPLVDQVRNKVILDIDGNSYSARFPQLLSSGFVVFKMSAFEAIGTILPMPWKNYIPVKMDLSDCQEMLEWAKTHDAELGQIARGPKAGHRMDILWCDLHMPACWLQMLLLLMKAIRNYNPQSDIQWCPGCPFSKVMAIYM